MHITSTEFQNNMNKYLKMVGKEDIFITQNGKSIARLTRPAPDKLSMLDDLVGILPDQKVTLEEIRQERLKRQ